MDQLKIYRKRFIPPECILLKDDIIVHQSEEHIVTKWDTLKPKVTLHHGASCYFLKEGYKVSKFYREDNSLIFWYCDIIDCEYNALENSLLVTDLLADVIVETTGFVKVIDLDELAESLEKEILTKEQLQMALHRLNNLLTIIYKDRFDRLQDEINRLGL
ncbi:DUF402 domain-containing protein [Lachnospiraceae bacterium OttesenSCG-928-D06]|nr:DUF402 domain-containing protein [Lachnospiraceae bacterium OttesenSCG-928-D06]